MKIYESEAIEMLLHMNVEGKRETGGLKRKKWLDTMIKTRVNTAGVYMNNVNGCVN